MRDMRAIESVSQIFLVIGENLNGISQELYSVISIVSSMLRSAQIQRDTLHTTTIILTQIMLNILLSQQRHGTGPTEQSCYNLDQSRGLLPLHPFNTSVRLRIADFPSHFIPSTQRNQSSPMHPSIKDINRSSPRSPPPA